MNSQLSTDDAAAPEVFAELQSAARMLNRYRTNLTLGRSLDRPVD